MNLKPLADRVIIRVLAQEEKTKSGILLPDTAKEKPQQGEVVAVGEGRTMDNGQKVAPQVKVGDKVVFAKYAGNEIKVEEAEYMILYERDIMAVVE
ncbi:MAG: co-chaperone GroES [Bacillota bacterium]